MVPFVKAGSPISQSSWYVLESAISADRRVAHVERWN
jgi:hypothetical protein